MGANLQNATPHSNFFRFFFQTSLELSSPWSSQKYCFGFYDFRNFFFPFSLTMGRSVKMLLLPQIAFEIFQTSPEFSSHWPSQKCCFDFEILSLRFFTSCFVFVNMASYGSKNFKRLLLPQIVFDFFFCKLLRNFLLNAPHKITVLDFSNFEFTIFHVLFFCFR